MFPLVNNPQMAETARSLSTALTAAGLASVVDTTGAGACGRAIRAWMSRQLHLSSVIDAEL